MSTVQLTLSTWVNLVLIFRAYLPPPVHTHMYIHTYTQYTHSLWLRQEISPNSHIIVPSSLCSGIHLLCLRLLQMCDLASKRTPFLAKLYSLKDFLTLALSDREINIGTISVSSQQFLSSLRYLRLTPSGVHSPSYILSFTRHSSD